MFLAKTQIIDILEFKYEKWNQDCECVWAYKSVDLGS